MLAKGGKIANLITLRLRKNQPEMKTTSMKHC